MLTRRFRRELGLLGVLSVVLAFIASCSSELEEQRIGDQAKGHDLHPFEVQRPDLLPFGVYEAEAARLSEEAIIHGPSWDEKETAFEASGGYFVELDEEGDFIEWTFAEAGQGLVVRYTIPDSDWGGGIDATLGLYVNGERIEDLAMTSRFAWQYFPGPNEHMEPSNFPSDRARMRFDDLRILLPSSLKKGDRLRLQKDSQDRSVYGIDRVEMEPISPVIVAPEGALDVTKAPYSAIPDDEEDDWSAFRDAAVAAEALAKPLYIPPGRFVLSRTWHLKDIEVQGAGTWRTELHFSRPKESGIQGRGGKIVLSDVYVTTENAERGGSHGLAGLFGPGSLIRRVWLEHFATGAWIGNYTGTSDVTDGLTITSCRFRNTYADGVNFAKGTRNSVVEYTHFRNNGDDAMATWPSDQRTDPATLRNTFRFNTIENTWRAGGLGIFGGRGHVAHDCLFRDLTGQAGIRVNTVFEGHPFSEEEYIEIRNMMMIRTATTDLWGNHLGALTIQPARGPIHYIRFNGITIRESQYHGIWIGGENGHPLRKIFLEDVTVTGSGQNGIHVQDQARGWAELSSVDVSDSKQGDTKNASALKLLRTDGGP